MGARGPAGKRSEEQLGHSPRKVDTVEVDLNKTIVKVVERPLPDEKWHHIAKMVYDSFEQSAQVVYYEPTDWAQAYIFCESLSRDLSPQVVGVTEGHYDPESKEFTAGEVHMAVIPLKGSSLSAYLKSMSNLLMTETDRRRAHIEIKRAAFYEQSAELPTGVTDIAAYRQDLTG